jgi:hypothetical protein
MAPFIMNFMFPVPDASLPAVEICSLTSAAGNRSWPRGDIVVFQEQDPHLLADPAVVIDQAGHDVDELDGLLGFPIAGGRLAAKEEGPWRNLHLGIGLQDIVQMQDMENIEELALVEMDPLDLDIKDGGRVYFTSYFCWI